MPEPDPIAPSSQRRQRAYRWGLSAETGAAWYLRLKGYRIFARRFKVARGEIDLVALKHRTLVFVEVKARAEEHAALEAVGPRSQRRIIAAADSWGQKYPRYLSFDWRYDIIVMMPRRWPRHHVAAFIPQD